MHIKLIAIGDKMPDWIKAGFNEYAKRLPTDYHFQLIEIPGEKRPKKGNLEKILQEEGKKLLGRAEHPLIALDRKGQELTTNQLAKHLQNWRDCAQNPSLLVGGPEGLAPECLQQADQIWSLSHLTFPHPLVRVILAEQIYRAWSILTHHPYHR